MLMRLWNRMPGEVVDSQVLEAFNVRLDGALGSLIYWVATLPTTEGVGSR